MKIIKIEKNKKDFLELLLIADEEEQMIDKYLESGEVFTLYDGDLKSICVVTTENDSYELKNIATYPKYQNQGYGSKLIEFVLNYYKSKNNDLKSKKNKKNPIKNFNTMYVGTGDLKRIISFYEKFGFKKSHKIKNFFIDNYNEPIFEDNQQLIDMIYLKKEL